MLKRVKKMLYRSLESKEVTYKKLQDILRKDENAILLDVRSKQEFKEGHLENAINIPLYDLEQHLECLPDKNCTIVVYCASGHRSKQAKEKLESLMYQNIYQLKDGLDGM